MSKLTVATPSPALVDGYLREIAKAYAVPWADLDEQPSDNSEEQGNQEKAKVSHP